ncbi:MAG: choice-of-anchor J domain-containing protein [Bacteroidales bacterium]|nr:choice-of-anchor J domain-containing protein [Bacteroidales bacterium]
MIAVVEMKKLLVSILCALAALPVMSQHYSFKKYEEMGGTRIEFTLDSYKINEIETAQGTFSRIDIGKNIFTERKGWPELPFASTTTSISDDDIISVDTSNLEYQEIQLDFPILPSRGTIYRNQNPDSIPYLTCEEALCDYFFPETNIAVEDAFLFRAEKKSNIRIFPFQYNARQKRLRIYDRISIRITHKSDRTATTLPNYDYGDILVLTPERYDSVIAPYIKWKREMGYNVTLQFCDSAENVRSRIAQAYNQNPNLLFVQIVGDWNDIQSDQLGTETCVDCPTDPALGCVSGTDDYPDVAIGRFSCNNEEELAIQIQKSINYEKNPNNCHDWREKFIGIGSEEGPGDDNELDYEHVGKIYENKLSHFTYNTHSQHYATTSDVSSNILASSINLGASSIAYCGHGSGSYWLTGNYGSASVYTSSNGDKLPFVISVACRNGAYHNEDCFAEKWMKAPHGGAVTTLMSSINQPWNPPMRGQDYFYDILSGGYDYDNDTTSNGLNTNEQRTHWGSIILNAFYLMLCESAQDSDIETVKTWISFGDASLQLRTKTPDKIKSSQNIATTGQNYTTKITTDDGTEVRNALVCLSQDGNYFKGFTNSRGIVTIGHNLHEGKALLVITAFNTTTIYDSIPVIRSGAPYINIIDINPTSVNSGISTKLSISLKNWGDTQSDSIRFRISCDDELITIRTDSAIFLPIQQGETAINNSIDIHIDNRTPYGHIFDIAATIEYNDTTIESHFNIALTGQDCYPPDFISLEQQGDSCTISWNDLTIKKHTIFDDFDNADAYPPFAINPAGNAGWTYIDGDDSQTGIISGYTFPNNMEKMAFIAFDPLMAYSDESDLYSVIHPHSGKRFLASIRSASLTTNDWIFSRELNYISDFEFSFYVRGSHQTNYWETMEVYYMTDDTIIRLDSCTVRGSADPDNWTFKTYSVPDLAKYVAIRNISRNKNFLCIDDIKISGYKIYPTEPISIFDNGTLLESGISGNLYEITYLENGEHCFSILPDCNANLYTDTTICITVFHEPCDAPENATCYITTYNDSIVWSPVPNAISYNIYESGQLIGNTSDTTFVTSSTIIPEGNYYTISSVCSNGESERTEVNTILVNRRRLANDATRIFPNPSNGNFIIEYYGEDAQYTVSDICGKNIAQGKLSYGQNALTLQGFTNGMYIIRICSGNMTHTHKIIKQ